MSIIIIIILMLLAGSVGGLINYYLPANTDANGAKIRQWFICMIIGIGAAILVPLFLELAQSKLMDNIHTGMALQTKDCDCGTGSKDTLNLNLTLPENLKKDSADIKVKPVVVKAQVPITASALVNINCCVPLKSYFLFLAYCFLAAAAGVRFITSIIDSVLKEKQIEQAKDKATRAEKEKVKIEEEKEEVEKDKQELEKANTRWIKNSRIDAAKLETDVVTRAIASSGTLPEIGPVTVVNDPQKGRFGGRAAANDRALKATVTKSAVPGFYSVKIWVETTDPTKPLEDDVVFYIHDSFSPSVYPITPQEFVDGKAVDDEILAYGAFTVGAVADKGKTLLELDLAEQPEFPIEFRER